MKIEKREHQMWKEFEAVKKSMPSANRLFGQWQYIYSSDKGEISLIELLTSYKMNWETHCFEGNLFEDCEQFNTKEEAEVRIKELLI